ncbi:tRNA (adenosine(37)-N6)-threonylcarbamoyltransferase complex ATPase subunit type 1 TsaE [candidate division GN15 bacterium]|nr:tRNA (adenosine(37)-N6)-threonylcarbamoyltransferase complex ATPase subunit type 1 TsaE [candidate division GN15 bacterium]
MDGPVRTLEIVSHNTEQTEALARKLAASFNPGDVIVLSGRLGSGKTTFVRALVGARGIDEDLVNSPSYTFVNEYKGEPSMYHFDLYRLGDISELREIGFDDYINRNGIVLVEWGEKAAEMIPLPYYLIEFDILDEDQRRIDISLIKADSDDENTEQA